MSHPSHHHSHPDAGPACGCSMDPDPTASTGFLPFGIAVLLLACAYLLGLFG